MTPRETKASIGQLQTDAGNGTSSSHPRLKVVRRGMPTIIVKRQLMILLESPAWGTLSLWRIHYGRSGKSQQLTHKKVTTTITYETIKALSESQDNYLIIDTHDFIDRAAHFEIKRSACSAMIGSIDSSLRTIGTPVPFTMKLTFLMLSSLYFSYENRISKESEIVEECPRFIHLFRS